MPVSPEFMNKMAQWRAKTADGTMTIEEYKEAITFLRGDRRAAVAASAASRRKKAKKEVKSAEEMLAELGGL